MIRGTELRFKVHGGLFEYFKGLFEYFKVRI